MAAEQYLEDRILHVDDILKLVTTGSISLVDEVDVVLGDNASSAARAHYSSLVNDHNYYDNPEVAFATSEDSSVVQFIVELPFKTEVDGTTLNVFGKDKHLICAVENFEDKIRSAYTSSGFDVEVLVTEAEEDWECDEDGMYNSDTEGSVEMSDDCYEDPETWMNLIGIFDDNTPKEEYDRIYKEINAIVNPEKSLTDALVEMWLNNRK